MDYFALICHPFEASKHSLKLDRKDQEHSVKNVLLCFMEEMMKNYENLIICCLSLTVAPAVHSHC